MEIRRIFFLSPYLKFTLGSMCFCQLIGIPMDSNPATFMAILFLYYYEKKEENSQVVLGLQTSYVFSTTANLKIITMTFILMSWNSKQKVKILVRPWFGTFQYKSMITYNYNDIYSDELELKIESKDPQKALFLDLSIQVHDKKYTTELFDERMRFPFLSYTYLRSDWLRGRQYSPYMCKERNMSILHCSSNKRKNIQNG